MFAFRASVTVGNLLGYQKDGVPDNCIVVCMSVVKSDLQQSACIPIACGINHTASHLVNVSGVYDTGTDTRTHTMDNMLQRSRKEETACSTKLR